ncbi:MAG: hypothetical protein J3K34DRAFT_527758, partial [Monoraphidium minutum]
RRAAALAALVVCGLLAATASAKITPTTTVENPAGNEPSDSAQGRALERTTVYTNPTGKAPPEPPPAEDHARQGQRRRQHAQRPGQRRAQREPEPRRQGAPGPEL